MRVSTKLPYELVLVETGTKHFEKLSWSSLADPDLRVDKYIHCPEKTTVVKDHNTGLRAASGDIQVFMGNDILVTEGWLEALLEPFERYPDCGLSSVATAEPGAFVGPAHPIPGLIVEGSYTPIMAFRKGWELDEAFNGGYSDSDLLMRVYTAGLRAYRHCGVQVHHLNHLTIKKRGMEGHEEIAKGEALFYERWGSSPLIMFQIIKCGASVYGREHEACLAQIVPYMERVRQGRI